MKKQPTQQRLKEVFSYDPRTGIFTRLKAHANTPQLVGKPVINNVNRYTRITFDGATYQAHNLAWLYMTGQWPTLVVDHRNTVRNDNRWTNLRDITHGENMQNQCRPKRDNSTGFLGVRPSGSRFSAKIVVNKKHIHLGSYLTPALAHEAYIKAKRELHPGCTI